MGLFGNLTTAGTEATEDRLGGGYVAFETDLYTGQIKMAYAGQSSGGARNVTLIVSGGDFGDKEYRETLYVTNRNGENFYTKDGKKHQLPAFIVMNHLCQVTVDKELSALEFEDKTVNVYDSEQKKEMPKVVPVAMELLGKTVTLAIVKSTENQTEKDGQGNYIPKADGSTRDVNNIEKVFHTASKMTVHEAQAKAKPGGENVQPEFWDAWQAKHKGVTRDKTNKNAGQNGKPAGAAPQAGGNAGAAGGSARSSLFGG